MIPAWPPMQGSEVRLTPQFEPSAGNGSGGGGGGNSGMAPSSQDRMTSSQTIDDQDLAQTPHAPRGVSASILPPHHAIASAPQATPHLPHRTSLPNSYSTTTSSHNTQSAFDESQDDKSKIIRVSQHPPAITGGSATPHAASNSHDAPRAAPASRRRNFSGALWNDEEDDYLLLNLVDRHGKKWLQMLPEFNKFASVERSEKALEARWRQLVIGSTGRPPLLPPSDAAQDVKPTLPLASSSFTRRSYKNGWSQREDDVLRASMVRHEGSRSFFKRVEADFFGALRKSTRTSKEIKERCEVLQREERSRCGGYGDDEEVEDDESVGYNDSGFVQHAAAGTRGKAAGRGRYGFPPHAAQQGTHGSTYTMRSQPLPGGTMPYWQATTPFIAPTVPLSRYPHHQQAQRHRQPPPPANHVPQDLCTSVNYLPDGIIITNLPSHYEARFYSPTRVSISRSLSPFFSSNLVDAHDSPAFHFRIGADGGVQAVRLPEGTRTHMGVVPAEGGAGLRGATGSGMLVETSFIGPDGWCARLRRGV